jgi:hypothetical protein
LLLVHQRRSAYEQQESNTRILLTERNNNAHAPEKIWLADFGYVVLQGGGKLSYKELFSDNERKVYLSG